MKRFSTLWGVPLAAVLGLILVGCGSSSDKTAPGTVGDFAASAKTETTITLSWTATGNDGSVGQATKSELRWSKTSLDAATFATGTLVAGAPAPAASGTAQSHKVTGLTAATTYYFGLMVADDAGNASYAFTSAATNACAAGYTGGDCTVCATGYHDVSGSCIDACSDVIDPCVAGIPASTCAGDVLTTHDANEASCTVDLTTAPYYTCTFTAPETDCTATGEICRGGACVDNPCLPTNPCTPTADACADNHNLNTYGSVCTPVDATTYDCASPLTVVDCTATAGNVCSGDACVAAVAPIAGDLVITEVMYGAVDGKSWIEILNVSQTLLNLDGLTITSTSSPTGHTINGTHLLDAGDYYVLGEAAVSYVNYVYGADVTLTGTETLTLAVGTTTVTSLAYTGWTGAPAAKQISSTVAVTGSSSAWYWCDATDAIGTAANDKGTPGAPNGTCGITIAAAPTACTITPATASMIAGGAFPVVSSLTWGGITDVNQAGNDNSPLLEGEVGYGTGADATAFTWGGAATGVAGYTTTGSVDSLVAPLAISGDPATYNFGVRFRVLNVGTMAPGNWVYCDTAGVVTDPTVGAAWGSATTTTLAASMTTLTAPAAAGTLATPVPVGGLTVTYVRDTTISTGDPKGFFAQAAQTGPALFVSVDPATLTPVPARGDVVSFTVTATVNLGCSGATCTAGTAAGSNAIRSPSAITNWVRQGTGADVAALAQEVSSVDLATLPATLNDYAAEIVNIDGTLASASSYGGTNMLKFAFATAGSATGVFVRFTPALIDQFDLVQTCQVSLRSAPLWRMNNTEPDPTAFAAEHIGAVTGCPAPIVNDARATSTTTITVSFDRQIAASSILADGSQFTIDNGITVTAAQQATSRSVALTVSALGGVVYTVTVASTVTDTIGTAMSATMNTAQFIGPTAACRLVPTLTISQLYPGGGASSGSPSYTRDFVELHNREAAAVNLSGWSLQYQSSGGTTWNVNLLSGVVPANGYFLITMGTPGNNGATLTGVDLPLPSSSSGLSATTGKIALVHSTAAMTGCTAANWEDLVSWGTNTAVCAEGTTMTAPANTAQALIRAGSGCTDNNLNSTDFTRATPAPRNSATTVVVCSCP